MATPVQAKPAEPTAPLNLLQKMAAIVREIDNVEKRGENTFQHYKYVTAADVAWAVRKALSDKHIYVVSDVVETRPYEIPAKEGVMQAIDLKMEFSFFDADAPDTPPIVLHAWGTGTDKGDKAVYKAMTGALKYGLRHAFLIPDASDPEADTSVDVATGREAAKEVGNKKIAALQASKAQREAQNVAALIKPTTLFYTWPEKHNGNYAEWINVKAYADAMPPNKSAAFRFFFSKYLSQHVKNGVYLVSKERMPELLEKLAGEHGIDIHEMREPGQEG